MTNRHRYWLMQPGMYHYRRAINAAFYAPPHRRKWLVVKAQIRAAQAYHGFVGRNWMRT